MAKKQKPKTFEKKSQRGEFHGGFRKDSNPDVIYGRDFEGDTIDLESITGEMGEVIIRGQVIDVEAREIRNEKTILIFPVTDFTDSIVIKMFLRNEQVPEITELQTMVLYRLSRRQTTVLMHGEDVFRKIQILKSCMVWKHILLMI